MRAAVCVTVLVIGMMGLDGSAGAQPDRLARARIAVAATPNDPARWMTLAEQLAQGPRISEAIDAYKTAIKLDPKAALPKLGLARVLRRTGDALQAALVLRDVLATSTDDDLVTRAWNDVIGIEEMQGTLGDLAQVLHPLAGSPVHRRLLVATYERAVIQLEGGATPRRRRSSRGSERSRWHPWSPRSRIPSRSSSAEPSPCSAAPGTRRRRRRSSGWRASP
jgi:thioredoxin-like negative regulator of GroEL